MSTILENWRQGKGFPDTLVIDCHTHIGTAGRFYMPPTPDDAARVAERQMDAHGVDAIVNQGRVCYVGSDYRLINDETLWIHEHYPRIIGFCHVNPCDRAESVVAELDRMFRCGLRGIKLIHEYQEQYPVDGPVLLDVYAFAREHGMAILNHDWQRPDALRSIARANSEIDLIIGHYGPRWNGALIECSNVYACTWSFSYPLEIEEAANVLPAEKLLVGSDNCLNPFASGLGPVVYARISDDVKRQILGLNMARILKRAGALPAHLAPWLDRQ